MARDGMLPFSRTFSKVSERNHLPVNACIMVAVLAIAINASVIGSVGAFTAIGAAATVGTFLSYLVPIVARQTVGRNRFKPAKWHLGKWSLPVALMAIGYIGFLFVVLMLPQLYPVNAVCTPLHVVFNIVNVLLANVQLLSGSHRHHLHHRAWWVAYAVRFGRQVLVHWTEADD